MCPILSPKVSQKIPIVLKSLFVSVYVYSVEREIPVSQRKVLISTIGRTALCS